MAKKCKMDVNSLQRRIEEDLAMHKKLKIEYIKKCTGCVKRKIRKAVSRAMDQNIYIHWADDLHDVIALRTYPREENVT